MKLERKFESKDNKLYFLGGKDFTQSCSEVFNASALSLESALPKDKSVYYRVDIKWSDIGMDEDSYNENLLASFRDWLKLCDENEIYVYVHPVCDGDISTEALQEAFVAGCKHCARRIKDCTSVIGFYVPEEVSKDYFVEELSAKHAHYVFFGSGNNLQDLSIVCEK